MFMDLVGVRCSLVIMIVDGISVAMVRPLTPDPSPRRRGEGRRDFRGASLGWVGIVAFIAFAEFGEFGAFWEFGRSNRPGSPRPVFGERGWG